MLGVETFDNLPDPVRDAMIHGEEAPAEYASWSHGECLRRLRMRFGLTRKELAARARVSASVVGRMEKGVDARLSTWDKLYAALGCRLLTLPAGGLYELDRRDACLDDAARDGRLAFEKAMADGALEDWERDETGPADPGVAGD